MAGYDCWGGVARLKKLHNLSKRKLKSKSDSNSSSILSTRKRASGFEHRVLKKLRQVLYPHSCILVAVSGGVDSMVLAEFFYRWQKLLKIDLRIAYVHHGNGDQNTLNYRNRSQEMVRRWCENHQLTYLTNPTQTLRTVTTKRSPSEEQLRALRWTLLEKWRQDWAEETSMPIFISTAHHADDLVETQLFRLLRGTSAFGLGAMSMLKGHIVRPFIFETKDTLRDAARHYKLSWEEDPSNLSSEPMRNWIRNEWLGALKERWPSALQTLARSLNQLALDSSASASSFTDSNPHTNRSGAVAVTSKALLEQALDRESFELLSPQEQLSQLASAFRLLKVRQFSQSHLIEIQRRLDNRTLRHKFRVAGLLCLISKDKIVLRPE